MKNQKAFTLVELIVVITILAILGTIGFISLQGFSSEARDSKRISELSELRSGLSIYQARNSILPIPSEQRITIGSGTTTLIIQGYAGESVLQEIRVGGELKDPVDKEYYVYSTNGNQTRFQLLSLLENDNNSTSYTPNLNIIPTTHANNENRHVYTVGQDVGALLDPTTNIPINQTQTGSIDLGIDNTNYKVVFLESNNTQTLSGINLYNEIVTKTNNSGTTQNNEPEIPEPTYSCETQPNYTNANFIIGEPTQENQTWQNTNNTQACYYECTNGYAGSQCATLNMSLIDGQYALYAGVYNPTGNLPRSIWVAYSKEIGQIIPGQDNPHTSLKRIFLNSYIQPPIFSSIDGRENTFVHNSNFPASYYCQNLNWAGYSDWYLPATHNSNTGDILNCGSKQGELQFLYCVNKGNGNQNILDFDNSSYYSSNYYIAANGRVIYQGLSFIDGNTSNSLNNNTLFSVRCIRVAD